KDNLSVEHGQAVVDSAQRHAETLAQKARQSLPEDIDVTSVVGRGGSTQEAVQSLDFSSSEFVLVGSSRLAHSKRLFLDSSTNKTITALPVSMCVRPNEYKVMR